ncbi:MAG TPA: excinuclease ABC subunit UvrA [Candidatus Brocadiia bacterium]|nr:excinuclease ABC subunit UvrA [Candidatus Brocadiales bacterium]
MSAKEYILIRGAREHNLKGINVDIPRDSLVVITGVSGSGKSSLAFDTIYAEGQRRYIESLSSYARQFLDQLCKPDVDHIEGLPPAVAIEQRARASSPRSTVGTITEVYDYLRLLFARVGTPHCYKCSRPITKQSPEQIVQKATEIPVGTKVMLLAPLVKAKKGEHKEVFEAIRKAGYIRARIDGKVFDIANAPRLSRHRRHDIEAVVDRMLIKEGMQTRLYESIQQALELGKGVMILAAEKNGKWKDTLFSQLFACPQCGISYEELAPRMFSFNSPYGACKRCDGLGVIRVESLESGVWSQKTHDSGLTTQDSICYECNGARLRPEALAVRICGKSINDVVSMDVKSALAFFRSLSFKGEKEIIAKQILKEITNRLSFMIDVGLHYLTLARTGPTLSGGEAQRVQLATEAGSGLVGVCYVLDEPTIGLHQRDNERLLRILTQLKELGNTIIVVEHDEATIRSADYVIDLGPGAGEHGGRIVSQGSIDEIMLKDESLTVKFLKRELEIETPRIRRKLSLKKAIEIRGARENNLKSINVKVPLQVFCCVTGVSGSGKSTLVDQILHRALARTLYGSKAKPGAHDKIIGIELIDKVIEIDQSPIGRTPRSNSVTYTNVFNHIRSVLARTREARVRGYSAGRFSFNVSGGRCEACKGQGIRKVEMHFLPEMYVMCQECKGKRYNRETLEVTYKGKSIADILDMCVEEAHNFFRNIPQIERIVRTLRDVGLGYMRLGQASTTLSGGEAQRVKLAAELAKRATGKTLYILDEPTTGLHFADIKNLLNILTRLCDMGNTVLVIEHNLDVIKTADYIIDLGPEGGEGGGEVVAAGTPEEVASEERSYTGKYLKTLLGATRHQS